MIILVKDLDIFDNKIIILYTISNSSKPLDITQIAKLCEEFEDINPSFIEAISDGEDRILVRY